MADVIQDATAVSNAMAEIYDMNNMKAQFSRLGRTTQFFMPRGKVMKGDAMHWKAFTQPYTGVRRVSTSSGSEAEFPNARQVDVLDIEADWDDIVEFQASITYTGLAQRKTQSKSDAVYEAASALMEGTQDDFVAQVNNALHQPADCTMAVIVATYDLDGTSLTTGTTAYINIDQGSIAQFLMGQILDIRSLSDNADVQVTVEVTDVYSTTDGPGDAPGPGIAVKIATTENTALSGDADLDALTDGDEIVLRGETSNNIQSFPTWFSTASVFNLTRTSAGYHWAVPHARSQLNGSSLPIPLDIEEHFGELAEELAYSIIWGRRKRSAKGIAVNPAMVAIGTPRLVAEATRQIGDAVRFTTALEGSERKKLFGRLGYSGAFWHSPTLGPVALQDDPVATPYTIRFLEPSSWFWITGHKGNSTRTMEWLDADGRRWHYKQGSSGGMQNQLQAGALMRLGFGCDQPGANFQLSGVKSSLETVS